MWPTLLLRLRVFRRRPAAGNPSGKFGRDVANAVAVPAFANCSTYKIKKLILAFAADRPKLADFQGACEDIDDSWWMGKVCCMGGLRARKLTTTRSH
jgi:hypothetical protein